MEATCVTDGCSEHGIAKPMEVELNAGELVICGVCGQPCELTGD
jgi:hypothetical protein